MSKCFVQMSTYFCASWVKVSSRPWSSKYIRIGVWNIPNVKYSKTVNIINNSHYSLRNGLLKWTATKIKLHIKCHTYWQTCIRASTGISSAVRCLWEQSAAVCNIFVSFETTLSISGLCDLITMPEMCLLSNFKPD